MQLRGAIIQVGEAVLRVEKQGVHYWIDVHEGDNVALSLMMKRDTFRRLLDDMMELSASESKHEVVAFNPPRPAAP